MVSKGLKLSREQSAAVKTFGADLGVSAGAGSGKTTVLVERYLEAVTAKGAWPEELLAVTFTDKAANVMKERLRRRCEESGLEEVRRRLDGAWIGTIHSFCARFLKENPLECGVDPLFTVMGAGEQDLLMEKALESLFEEESMSDPFVKILSDADEEAVRSSLKFFYGKQRSYAGQMDLLRSVSSEKQRAKAESDLLAALEREIPEKGAALSDQEEKVARACRAAKGSLASPAGWPRRSNVLSALYELDRKSKKTKERVQILWDLAEAWAALEVQAFAVPFKNEWRRLIGRFAEVYEKEKRRLGTHDYEDLLVLTHRALSGTVPAQKALRARTQKQFAFIFVDEFQDTSVLQAKIFELIKRKDNLFAVGDVRQSIYRFRHAHPEIFLEALKRSKSISLAENYRSRPEILDFANDVFKGLFGSSHEPLQAKRVFKLKKEHCLEFLGVPRSAGTLDPNRVIEARSIAARIRGMVDSEFQVEEGGKPRPVRWKDFAVLLRRTTVSRLYEKEFEAFGIPYYANKGRGFYEKNEVADLVNLLQAVETPSENIAMASVLRSPLVQVSDDALYWLSRARLSREPEGSLHDAVTAYEDVPELSQDDRTRLAAFLPLLTKMTAQKDRLKISELLHTAVKETAYEAKVLTQPGGRQARANIWKLIEMAGSLEDKNVRSISDFILYLQKVSESSETEAEARIVGEEEDVVRILTVHAAKGLEFPVVILADLGGEEGKSEKQGFLCSVAEGLGAKLRDPEAFEFCEDAAFAVIKREEKRMNEEEADRLLYVAMTRAKEHLILSGVLDKAGAKSGSFSRMSELERALTAAKTVFYRVPVVFKRPEPPPAGPLLAEGLSEKSDPRSAQEVERLVMPVAKPYETLEDLTVSRLVAAVSLAGAVKAPRDESPEEPEEDEATPRNEFGTMFHLLMEISTRRSPRGHLSAQKMAELTTALTAQEKGEIGEAFERFWESALGDAVKRSAKCYPELPFIYKTKHGILKGQIDLVFQETGGGWMILDYKTNRFSNDTEKKEAVELYRWQLGLYALAFWRLYGEIPKKTALYFTTSHEVTEVKWEKKELEVLSRELEDRYRSAVGSESA